MFLICIAISIAAGSLSEELTRTVELFKGQPLGDLVTLLQSMQEKAEERIQQITMEHQLQQQNCQVQEQSLIIEELMNEKMDLRDRIQYVKPRIEQINIMKQTTINQNRVLDLERAVQQQRRMRITNTYKKWTDFYESARFDWVSYKQEVIKFIKQIPDRTIVKPTIYALTVYADSKLYQEDQVYDLKINNLLEIPSDQDVTQFDNQIQELEKQKLSLEIQMNDLDKRINVFLSQFSKKYHSNEILSKNAKGTTIIRYNRLSRCINKLHSSNRLSMS